MQLNFLHCTLGRFFDELQLRVLIRANKWRQYRAHVFVFFIFLSANIGGSLSPLGDPPLFLAFLKGIEFSWFLRNMIQPASIAVVLLISMFLVLDMYLYHNKEDAWIRLQMAGNAPEAKPLIGQIGGTGGNLRESQGLLTLGQKGPAPAQAQPADFQSSFGADLRREESLMIADRAMGQSNKHSSPMVPLESDTETETETDEATSQTQQPVRRTIVQQSFRRLTSTKKGREWWRLYRYVDGKRNVPFLFLISMVGQDGESVRECI
jgi:hypothetical protein